MMSYDPRTMEVIQMRISLSDHTGLAALMAGMILLCTVCPALGSEDVPRMDKEELRTLLDNPDIVILDVRSPSDWNRSEYKIKGAQRLDQSNRDNLENLYPKDKTLVVYCS
jgi:hypothetical protein